MHLKLKYHLTGCLNPAPRISAEGLNNEDDDNNSDIRRSTARSAMQEHNIWKPQLD